MGARRAFKQWDVTRAIKAARAAGLTPHIWIDRDGRLHIQEASVLTASDLEPQPSNEPNPWNDRILNGKT